MARVLGLECGSPAVCLQALAIVAHVTFANVKTCALPFEHSGHWHSEDRCA
ncbi:MAG: hypothetical protein ACYCXN_07410 [Acidimicrobiales bacterium]